MLEKARDAGDKFYRPKRISGTEKPQAVAGAGKWKTYRKHLLRQLRETRKQRDIARYGKGFVYYRIARRADARQDYEYALTAYEQVSRVAPNTVYAEAARCYYGYVLEKLGRFRQAEKHLADFINDNPLGLYRGEALLHLGEVNLRRNLDTRRALHYFSKTLEWEEKVRTRDRDINLYVVPEKARRITAAAPKALKENARGRLVPVNETPAMVINRRTADWYRDRLAWRAGFHSGFLKFYDGDYEAAKNCWKQAFDRNEQLQKQHKSQLGSFYRRLECACRGRRFIATPQEMKAFRRGKYRLQIMLADFHALWLRWKPAERLYTDLL
ncbi:MAG: hypothetical protein R6V56_08145, partial [Lentisphaeria bacterium]